MLIMVPDEMRIPGGWGYRNGLGDMGAFADNTDNTTQFALD